MTDAKDDPTYFVDANGCPAERTTIGGVPVILHYDDIPESDVTTVNGFRCTTPVRTVLDLAVELEGPELEDIVDQCLERGLFTQAEVLERIERPDMRRRPGAAILGRLLKNRQSGGPTERPTSPC